MSQQTLLEERAERGEARGAADVLAAARARCDVVTVEPLATRRRRRAPVAVAVAAAAAVVAAIALWPDARTEPSTVTGGGEPSESQPAPGGGDALSFAHPPDRLPRVVLDRPGFRVEAHSDSRTPRAEGTPGEGPPVLIYQDPDLGYGGPMLWIREIGVDLGSAGSTNGFDGQQASLSEPGRAAVSLTWDDGAGGIVLVGIGVIPDRLVEIGASVVRDRDGVPTVNDTPPGVELVATARPAAVDPVLTAETEFALDGLRGDLWISSGGPHELIMLLEDRLPDAIAVEPGDVGGHPALLLTSVTDPQHSAVWQAEDLVFELRGEFASLEELQDAIADVAVIDDAAWDRIAPADWVPTTEAEEAVAAMLTSVPLPDALDLDALASLVAGGGQRYQIAATVVGRVACAWIDQWVAATAAGDADRATEAVEAMATSRNWPILTEMAEEGRYPAVVWTYADGIAGDGTVAAGTVLTVEESYEDALGC